MSVLKRILRHIVCHTVAAVVSGSCLFFAVMVIYDYSTRNEPTENLRYEGIGIGLFFMFALGSVFLVSLPMSLIVQWWQKRYSRKSQFIPFIGPSVIFFITCFFGRGVITNLPYLAYLALNFALYSFVFVSSKKLLLKEETD